MIFNILFKRKIDQFKNEEKRLWSKIQNEINEKNLIKKELELEQEKHKRIKYLLNNRIDKKSTVQIATTKKNVLVLLAIKEYPFQIEVFDLITLHYSFNRVLVLWGYKRDKSFFIQDIQGGQSLGHGELAIDYLIKHAKNKHYESITGELAECDVKDHKERLIHFYTKFGFILQFQNREGSIFKPL